LQPSEHVITAVGAIISQVLDPWCMMATEPAVIGTVPMQRTMAGFVAIVVAMPLLSCSMNLNWDSDKSDKSDKPSPQAAQDDSACQSSGFTFGTPEYQQCLQALVQQRARAEHADVRPYYGLQR
jgi:hypothetical protein